MIEVKVLQLGRVAHIIQLGAFSFDFFKAEFLSQPQSEREWGHEIRARKMGCENQPVVAGFEDGEKDTMRQGVEAAFRRWERQEWALP